METKARFGLIGVFTLAIILGGFAFAYWLRNVGGFRERAVYRIRFENPVTGLLPGSTVLFNGIQVGEVTGLQLDSDKPEQVTATIAVQRTTPVRADTQVGLDSQGLMGDVSISLRGGTGRSLPLGSAGEPAVLQADPSASQDLSHAAREALRRFDALIADNAEPLHDTITNLSTFTGALARNSDRLDGIISGLERLTGGGSSKPPAPIYDLTAPSNFPPPEKTPDGQLVVSEPTALVLFDTQKILVRPRPDESATLDAQWSDSLPKLLQAKIIESFENAGYLRNVSQSIEGLSADYQLLLEIRSFQLSLTPTPTADVEFTAKILTKDGRILDARIFRAQVPAQSTDAPTAAAALDEAFGKAATDLVLWTSKVI
jgi:phospholipid/cholesterol/gamma-HCH transport system substrate-binding protein